MPKQNLSCVGCSKKFDRANALMDHIEKSECDVIKATHFHRQRAEKQISRDAWKAMNDPTAGTTIVSGNIALTTDQPDLTLLDDPRAFVNRDWQGRPDYDPDSEENGPYVGTALDEHMQRLSINNYPTLGAQSQTGAPSGSTSSTAQTREVFNVTANSHPPVRTQQPRAWSQAGSGTKLFQSHNHNQDVDDTTSQRSLNLLDNPAEDESRVTWGSKSNRAASSTQSIHKRISSPDSNPNSSIHTVQKIDIPSHINIDSFWDPLQENYACPAQKCGARFPSIEKFVDHLHSGAHVVTHVTCPGCLKRFRTTAALISHCESGSRKCKVRNAIDYDLMIREVTAGMISTDGYLPDGSIKYTATEVQDW